MTWSRFDDAAPKHPKAIAAGNEAWSLWVGAVMYCNRYLTDGFVPTAALATECLPEPITATKAKKLAQRLVDSKLRVGGPGLFVAVDGGFMVHDFLEWNPCKADVESKRKADRDRKRPPAGSRPDSERIPSGIPPDGARIPDGNKTDSVVFPGGASPARPPAPARARAPSPAQPSHTRPEDEEASSSPDYTNSDTETVIPLDLVDRADRAGVFSDMVRAMPGVTVEQLRDKARSFVAYWTIGGGTGKRRRHWMAKLREEIRKAHEQNHLRPPGAIEHDANGSGDPRANQERKRAREAMEAAYASAPEGAGHG